MIEEQLETPSNTEELTLEQKLQKIDEEQPQEAQPSEEPKDGQVPEPHKLQSQESQQSTEPSVPSWEAPKTFKVYGEEREIPEDYREFLSDSQKAEKITRLLSKAEGFEKLKNDFKEQYNELREIKPRYESINQKSEEMVDMLKGGDVDSFLDMWGVPFELKVQYARKIAQIALNPDVQERYNQERKAFSEARSYQDQLNQAKQEAEYYRTQSSEFERQQHDFQIRQMITSDQKLSEIQKFYEEVNGEGSLTRDMWQRADMLYKSTGQQVTPQQVIEELTKPYQWMMAQRQSQPQPQPTPAAQPQVVQVNQNKKPPVIPNVGGAGTSSPVEKEVRSIDDLKKIYEQEYGSAR